MHARAILLGAMLFAMLPATAAAQHVSRAHGPVTDRFQLEPYTGRYFDNLTRGASSFDESGWLAGLRLGLAMTDRARLIGDLGYSQVRDSHVLGIGEGGRFESQSWLVTGGVELDMIPGDTRASLSLQSGKLFRRVSGLAEAVEGWKANTSEFVVVPGFSVSQRITPRADIRLGVQDYIAVGADPISHNWALVAGLTLR